MRIVWCVLFITLFTLPAQASEKFLNLKEVTSPGGVKAWLVEDHSLPIISIQFAFRDSGSALDTLEKQGRTQLLSNTLDEGAGDLDSQTFQKTLDDNSITLKFSSSRDSFSGTVKTLSRTKEKAFELLKLALMQPRFDVDAVERMRQANLTRIRSSLSDPNWKAARIMNDVAYEGHPYALNSGGTLSSLKAVTPADLRDIAKSRLTRDKLFIAATGDITEEELVLMLVSIFEDLPASSSLPAVQESTIQNSGTITLYEQDIPQTIIQIKIPAFGRDDPDYYALRVMNYIFGGAGFGSYLMEEAREKRGLTYGIYSTVRDTRKIDDLTIGTSTKNESVTEMLDIIKAQMDRMKTETVSEDKLKKAKSYLTGSLPLSLTSTDKISGMVLSLLMQDLPIAYLDDYIENINAVTKEDIKRVAKRVLQTELMTVVLVGQPLEIETAIVITELPNVE